jgi:hypothetical protein
MISGVTTGSIDVWVAIRPSKIYWNPIHLLSTGIRFMGVIPMEAKYYIDLEEKYGAHNYKSLDVVLTRGSGV